MSNKEIGLVHLLQKSASGLSSAGAVVSTAAFVFMVVLTVAEVILRSVFGKSTLVASEYSGYLLAAMIYLGMGFSFREEAHIRITFLKGRLSGRIGWVLELWCYAFACVLCVLSTIFIWDMVLTSFERGMQAYTVAETPLYIPQACLLIGMAVFTFQVIAGLVNLIFHVSPREF